MESLCSSLERSVSLTLGNRAEMISNVDMQSCFLEVYHHYNATKVSCFSNGTRTSLLFFDRQKNVFFFFFFYF